MAAGTGGEWPRFQAALRSSLRLLRDSLRQREEPPPGRGGSGEAEEQQPSALEALPIDVKLYILSFLTPEDLCHLGSTSHYWQLTVQDPLLWRYLLFRDLPSWHSIDWKSLPDANVLNRSFPVLHEGFPADYMAVYKKCSSWRKRPLKSGKSLLHSPVTQAMAWFAMFGPGLEDSSKWLVSNMMKSSKFLLLDQIPPGEINGIRFSVTFRYRKQRFGIMIPDLKISNESRTDSQVFAAPNSNMFCETISDETMMDSPIEIIQNLCRTSDGFIYVADAEAHKRHSRKTEVAWMEAMLNPALGPPGRPVLVLSCVSSTGIERIPCIYMAHQLQLNSLGQPWMVQDTEVATLAGLFDGIEWLLGETRYNNFSDQTVRVRKRKRIPTLP